MFTWLINLNAILHVQYYNIPLLYENLTDALNWFQKEGRLIDVFYWHFRTRYNLSTDEGARTLNKPILQISEGFRLRENAASQ